MKRKHKTYSKPKRPFEKARLDEEAGIKKQFGLKNKKEIWKAEANIRQIRRRAKSLISAKEQEKQKLFDKLNKAGIKVNSIADVLSLDKRDYLKRRLQNVLLEKKMATTQKSARQLITHRKVLVNSRVVDSPSYIVPVAMENKITLKPSKKKSKSETAEEPAEIQEKNLEEEQNA